MLYPPTTIYLLHISMAYEKINIITFIRPLKFIQKLYENIHKAGMSLVSSVSLEASEMEDTASSDLGPVVGTLFGHGDSVIETSM